MAEIVLLIVLAILATYRLATDLAWEAGPFALFDWLRGLASAGPDWFASGARCPICLSFWIAAILALVLGLGWLEWLAIAGGAAYLARRTP